MNLILAYRVYDNLYCVYLSHDSNKNQIIFSGYPASFISNQLSQNFSVREIHPTWMIRAPLENLNLINKIILKATQNLNDYFIAV